MRRRRRVVTWGGAGVLVIALHGCAAVPLAVVAGSLLEASGGVLVKTGTEYTASGAVLRTFNLSGDQVHAAVLETFRRAQIAVVRDDTSPKDQRVVGKTQGRTVRVRLLSLTPVLTSMELVVKRNFLASDKATASELLAETEQVLSETTTVALCDDQTPSGRPRALHAARPNR